MKMPFNKKPLDENTQPKAPRTEAEVAAGRRTLKNGVYASILAVIVLVAVILVNLVVSAIPTKYTQRDISLSGMFTLSDTTKNALSALDRDITAYYLAETGKEDANISRMLDRYAGESSHFKWEQKDPVLYPTFASAHNAANVANGSVILVCGDKSVPVDYNDMYQADYSDYYTTGSYSLNFAAENALTAGIAKVTTGASYSMCQLTGHGEASLEADFTDTLDNAGVVVAELNLLSGTIPEDAAALIINCPQVDYSAENIAAIQQYLDNGGNLIVATDLSFETPNLDALLAGYGMSRQPGLLIETDQNYYGYGYSPTYLLPKIQTNDVTGGMTSGIYVFTPIAQGILCDSANADVTYTALLTTSTGAYSMVDYATAETAQKADSDPEGEFDVAVAAQSAATGAKVVWANCGSLYTAAANQMVSGGNAQLLGSIVNWIDGEENAVVIDSKSMNAQTLTVPSNAVVGLGLLLVIALPLAVLVAGIVLFVLRRRK